VIMKEPFDIVEPAARDGRGEHLEPRFRFRRVNEITGAFVLLIVALVIAGIVWTERSQRWFRSNVTLRISLPETGAAGIRQGSEVYFLGTHVGSISDVIVDAAGHMEAEAHIRRDYFRFVRADSSAVVKKKFGVAGDSFFEITRGNGNPLPEKDAIILCNEQFQSALESAIEEVRREVLVSLKKTSAGLDTWNTLGSNLITSRERLDQIFVRVDTITADLQQGKGTAGKLLTDSATADELQTLVVKANAAMDVLKVTLKNFQSTSSNLQAASTNLPAISSTLAGEAKDLPGLVLQTQTSMRELERLIEAMQKNWLVRKHLNPTNPPPARSRPESAELEKKPITAISPKNSARYDR
jgi:phospholipid/cholesterol/gamma-HCH transport system substrate-binding protein